MYLCWGTSPRGPLRRRQAGRADAELLRAASGERHSLLLLSNGELHSCGDNSQGQLGRKGVQHDEHPSECGTKVRGGGRPDRWAPGYCETMIRAPCARVGQFRFPEAQFVSISSSS